ncbi:hypothetical protein HPB48_012051 [Haemaphysalis longicornis]|uniref:Tick transposon n=1 Tax=Haemaphysalis longicornis TaxID=44386 RepID=A0A9J6GAQ9_HAELO|nr:hypothetical protein HPB48_012051 [Haemaphysalis longicornis]
MVFIKEAWLAETISCKFKSAEVLAFTISKPEASSVIVAVYRPPNSDLHSFFEEFSVFLRKITHEILIIAADFNIDISDPRKRRTSDYLDLLAGFGMDSLIYKFTREEILASRLTQSCIDQIASRCSKFETLATVVRKKVADHYFTALCALSTQSVDTAHFIDHIDNNKRMDALIQKYEWSLLSVTDNVAAYDQPISQYNTLLSLSTKKVKLRSPNPQNKWITMPILEVAHEKDRLWKRCKNNPSDLLLQQEYRIIRNRLTAKLRLTKKQYFVAEFGKCRNNMRKTCGLLNDLMDKPRQKKIR